MKAIVKQATKIPLPGGVPEGRGGFSSVIKNIHIIGIIIFMIAVLWVLPLYHRGMFNLISEAKFQLYRNASLIIFGILSAATIANAVALVIKKSKAKQKIHITERLDRISTTDWFVLFYLIITFFSFLIQDWHEGAALWGFTTTRMGLMTQVFYVLTYFFISRYYTIISDKSTKLPNTTRFSSLRAVGEAIRTNTHKLSQKYKPHAVIICAGMLFVAFIVMLLGVLNRFWFDPFNILEGIHPKDVTNAMSTIGNPVRFSAFIALMIPFGMFIYWQAKSKVIRTLMVIFMSVGFAAGVTQNSESHFGALVAILLVFFWYSFTSNTKMKRFLEIVIVMLATFRIIGMLQMIDEIRMYWLDPIWLFLSRSEWMWPLLGFVIILYVALCHTDKESKIDVSEWGKFRLGCNLTILTGIILVTTYTVLNSIGVLPETISRGGVFLFNDEWGNGRGFNWRIAISLFQELSAPQILFGTGPSGFRPAATLLLAHELPNMPSGASIGSVQNEWLEAFVNGGILGGIAYTGIFISAIKRYIAKIAEHPLLLPICASLAGYMAHNIFTFQKINTTPAIFIFIAVAEAVLREKRREDRGK